MGICSTCIANPEPVNREKILRKNMRLSPERRGPVIETTHDYTVQSGHYKIRTPL